MAESDPFLTCGLYSAAEAGKINGLHPNTIHAWFRGRGANAAERRAAALFGDRLRAPGQPLSLSFLELVETFVAARLREGGVSLQRLRGARAWALQELGVDYPFAEERFGSYGGRVTHRCADADANVEEGALLAVDSGGAE